MAPPKTTTNGTYTSNDATTARTAGGLLQYMEFKPGPPGDE
jgi:hypothetical protein